jgi:hypothetical protein
VTIIVIVFIFIVIIIIFRLIKLGCCVKLDLFVARELVRILVMIVDAAMLVDLEKTEQSC